MKLINGAAGVGVAISAFAFAGVLIGMPTAAALPGVAGLDNELNYLDHLASVTDVSGVSKEQAVEAGYSACLIQQMGGSVPPGTEAVLWVANQHLCDFMPPLPAAQQPGPGVPGVVDDVRQQIQDDYSARLQDDLDGPGNNDDVTGPDNVNDPAPRDDDYN